MTGKTWLTGAVAAMAIGLVAADFAHADSWRRAQRRALRIGYGNSYGVAYSGAGYGHGNQTGGYVNGGGYQQACPCECQPDAPAQYQQGQIQYHQGQIQEQQAYQHQPGQPYSAARPNYEGAIDPGQQPRDQYFPNQQPRRIDAQGRIDAKGRVESDLPGAEGVQRDLNQRQENLGIDVNAARQNAPLNPATQNLNNQIQNSVEGLNR